MSTTTSNALTVYPAWVCAVVRSGYHNGAGCSPRDPHEDWDCQYRYETSLPASERTAALLESHGITIAGSIPQ